MIGNTVLSNRVVAFIIDMIFIGIAFSLYTILIMPLLFGSNADYFSFEYSLVYNIGLIIIVVSKDIFGGRSLGKIIKKLRIVDVTTNEKSSLFRVILRNITFMFMGPIELFIGFVRKDHRRVGDLLAGTKVISEEERVTQSI
ncbi:RDD family protein [Pseudalkalibacillus berkeleyi]|uniref:RDD family protein n=1 Tax=Pseudalkalibacillus berkeleyi TaxID=1069813 RepID=A0ABS9H1I4_9BACL|nr:RDD family protein [Pseudalkalibacillus berkeleyi]MCF6138853.1 RDD family protein [Pseudalkalibacillus berkeleyi]